MMLQAASPSPPRSLKNDANCFDTQSESPQIGLTQETTDAHSIKDTENQPLSQNFNQQPASQGTKTC